MIYYVEDIIPVDKRKLCHNWFASKQMYESGFRMDSCNLLLLMKTTKKG